MLREIIQPHIDYALQILQALGERAMKPCVFCGEYADLTKEHIWGKWIRDYIPVDPKPVMMRDVEVSKSGLPDKVSITKRAGSALGMTRKIVCAPCNNEWMSRIQARAKPFLIPLLEGRRTALGIEAQAAIATWATMVTMTAEFMLHSAGKIGISREDRAALRATEAPLPAWDIWIGYYEGGFWDHHWTHTSLPIVGGADLPSPDNVYTPLPNTQTTTFVVGKLYVHTMRCAFPEVSRNWHWLHNVRLRRLTVPILPVRHELVAWPIHGMSDLDIRISSELFITWVGDIARQHGF